MSSVHHVCVGGELRSRCLHPSSFIEAGQEIACYGRVFFGRGPRCRRVSLFNLHVVEAEEACFLRAPVAVNAYWLIVKGVGCHIVVSAFGYVEGDACCLVFAGDFHCLLE